MGKGCSVLMKKNCSKTLYSLCLHVVREQLFEPTPTSCSSLSQGPSIILPSGQPSHSLASDRQQSPIAQSAEDQLLRLKNV
jgi:hypothetical protein